MFRSIVSSYNKIIESKLFSETDGINYWQDRIIHFLAAAAMLLGPFLLGIGIIQGKKYGLAGPIASGLLIYSISLFLLLFKKIKFSVKQSLLIYGILLEGMTLFFYEGLRGAALAWLAVQPLISAFIHSNKWFKRNIVIMIAVYSLLFLLITFNFFPWLDVYNFHFLDWLRILGNNMVLSFTAATAIAIIIYRFTKTLQNYKDSEKFLMRNNDELERYNTRISKEVELRKAAQETLLESEKLYRTLFDHTSTALVIIARNGTVLMANNEVCRFTGLPLQQIENNMNVTDFLQAEDQKIISAYTKKLKDGNFHPQQYEIVLMNAQKEPRYLIIRIATIPGSDKSIASLLDITERKQMEKALIVREERLQAMLKHSFEVICIINEAGEITFLNKSVERIFGYSANEMTGRAVSSFVHPKDLDKLVDLYKNSIRTESRYFTSNFRFKSKQGTWKIVEASANNLLHDSTVKGIVLIIRDITTALEAEQKAKFFEFHDDLTGLPNLSLFTMHLDDELKLAHRHKTLFAVAVIDIHKFHNINEIFGQKAGDLLLKTVAKRLVTLYRETDCVSRFHGDKFIVCFSDIKEKASLPMIINKTIQQFQEKFFINEKEIKLSISLGACVFPFDGVTPEALIKNAESAMYNAKTQGGNSYSLFNEDLNERNLRSIQLQHDLVSAIEKQEFLTYYQIKVYKDGSISGLEALARWITADKQLIQPDEFIPLAESVMLVHEIGKQVFSNVCKDIIEWEKKAYPYQKVAVNVSPIQFKHSELVSDYRKIMKEYGVNPKSIEIEITESSFLEKEDELISKLIEFRNVGMSVAIDDFGTGYSSLSKIKSYPVDTVKIDKTFIQELPNDASSCELVHSIINLAHKMNFSVTAEGVEREEQVAFLIKENCDELQGFYFFKPVKALEIDDILKSYM